MYTLLFSDGILFLPVFHSTHWPFQPGYLPCRNNNRPPVSYNLYSTRVLLNNRLGRCPRDERNKLFLYTAEASVNLTADWIFHIIIIIWLLRVRVGILCTYSSFIISLSRLFSDIFLDKYQRNRNNYTHTHAVCQ